MKGGHDPTNDDQHHQRDQHEPSKPYGRPVRLLGILIVFEGHRPRKAARAIESSPRYKRRPVGSDL
jgi:hypothetical protein